VNESTQEVELWWMLGNMAIILDFLPLTGSIICFIYSEITLAFFYWHPIKSLIGNWIFHVLLSAANVTLPAPTTALFVWEKFTTEFLLSVAQNLAFHHLTDSSLDIMLQLNL
jgi:hypothetical protein